MIKATTLLYCLTECMLCRVLAGPGHTDFKPVEAHGATISLGDLGSKVRTTGVTIVIAYPGGALRH